MASRSSVAEGGSSQQVRAFDVDSGRAALAARREGRLRGARSRGERRRSSLSMRGLSIRRPHSASSTRCSVSRPMAHSGSATPALSRLLKFDGGRHLSERDRVPADASTRWRSDRNDPSRVFAEYTEYAVDYTQAARSRLAARAVLSADSPQPYGRSSAVRQRASSTSRRFGNGRTYGLARTTNGASRSMEIPKDGDLQRFPLRLQQPVIFLKRAAAIFMACRTNSSGRMEVWRRPLSEIRRRRRLPFWGREETRARTDARMRDPRAERGGEHAMSAAWRRSNRI